MTAAFYGIRGEIGYLVSHLSPFHLKLVSYSSVIRTLTFCVAVELGIFLGSVNPASSEVRFGASTCGAALRPGRFQGPTGALLDNTATRPRESTAQNGPEEKE